LFVEKREPTTGKVMAGGWRRLIGQPRLRSQPREKDPRKMRAMAHVATAAAANLAPAKPCPVPDCNAGHSL
jgi:hypothetical protein